MLVLALMMLTRRLPVHARVLRVGVANTVTPLHSVRPRRVRTLVHALIRSQTAAVKEHVRARIYITVLCVSEVCVITHYRSVLCTLDSSPLSRVFW